MSAVFISYRHESAEHALLVRNLAQRIRAEGLTVELDQFFVDEHPGGPDEGWPKWCADRAVNSGAAIVVASAGWFAASEGKGSNGEGLGAAAEAGLFRNEIYNGRGINPRVRFVELHAPGTCDFPPSFQGWHRFYPNASRRDFEQLIAWLRQRISTVSATTPGRLPEVQEEPQEKGTIRSISGLYLAVANTRIYLESSDDGLHWSPPAKVDAHPSAKGCALAVFRNRLWLGFVVNNSSHEVRVRSTPNGIDWSPETHFGQWSSAPPAIAVFSGRLWCAFVANDPGNRLLVCCTEDGLHWSKCRHIGQWSGTSPALADFDGKLWVAFVANDDTKRLLVCSKADGDNWEPVVESGQFTASTPALAVYRQMLWLVFIAKDPSHDLIVCSSTNGIHWSPSRRIGRSSDSSPAVAVFDDKLWIAFIAKGSEKEVRLCSFSHDTGWCDEAFPPSISGDAVSFTASTI